MAERARLCDCGLDVNVWQNPWNHRAGCSMRADELAKAQATIDRVRAFVDGFEERGDGLPLNTTDQLWIVSIRKVLDGDAR